ncbi:SMP-30/gluconolactonase/LRE family protein [Tunicatimonas pelagia]|uniref:SMP-30/gluconolactonase/LRE family protein n=1 Tax=Tunicatimonas pelagia TaxID=931531 RepID=UPI0026665CD3|nr:SMP-30/gluconolactonase/LRE family protein [Tunicatimonas pelagia]WKN42510.1 SMP-30/gluconolactonase/LRE family protein [Tunicatimonas pelagia]
MKAALQLKWNAIVGEGPVWDYRQHCLYWVDILRGHIYKYDPQTGDNQIFEMGQYVGAAVPRSKEGLIVALQHGFGLYDEENKALTMLNDPETHLPKNRFNDGKVDAKGRLWAGTMQIDPKEPQGSLYVLDTTHKVEQKLDNIYISNGLIWSPDNQWFYFIDSLKGGVDCYRFDLETAAITYEREVLAIDPKVGVPDGMTIDEEGNLWVAVYDGGRVIAVNPNTGKIIQQIDVPAKKTSSCTFGGENLDTLFITTISENTDPNDEPLAGSLFSVKPGVRGIKANFYAG